MILLIAFAFLAGVVTILSPCILPILPIILSSTFQGQNTGKSRPFGVVTGFVLSFTLFTLFLSTIVRVSGISADALRLVSVAVIALFGVSLLLPQFQVLVERLFSKLAGFMPSSQNKNRLPAGRQGFGGGLLVGFSVGLLWTPCVGPILASVISLAITGTVTFDAFLITLAYSLGTAIPMFLIILGGQNALRKVPWLLANTGKIQKIFGILMIITAIGIYFNVDRRFQTYILETFPQYGAGLTKFEDNEMIKKQLKKKSGTQMKNEDLPVDKASKGKPMFNLIEPKGVKAPEIIPGGVWFNSDPLTLSQLEGKVVIIDFWTYSCINCQRTMPYLRAWHEKYKDNGLVIIGVHSPEFEFEKKEKNVAQAIKDFKLTYPIVQDNDFATWRAYDNLYWPAKYLIDAQGNIRYTHFGEGKYEETEKVIQELLKEKGTTVSDDIIDMPDQTPRGMQTPETYLGRARIDRFASPEIIAGKKQTFTIPEKLSDHSFAYGGTWTVQDEQAIAGKNAVLEFNFYADKVYLVITPKNGGGKMKVFLDGKPVDAQFAGADVSGGVVSLDTPRLYNLIDLKGEKSSHILRLEFEDEGTSIYAFTFG